MCGEQQFRKPLSSILRVALSSERLLVTMPMEPMQQPLLIEGVSLFPTWFQKSLAGHTEVSVMSPLGRCDLYS